MKNKILLIVLFCIYFCSCSKESNPNTQGNPKPNLLDIWTLDEIEIVKPPDGSSALSWKSMLSMMGSTSVFGLGACTLTMINKLGVNEWTIHGSITDSSINTEIGSKKPVNSSHGYKGFFTYNTKEIFFTYHDDYKSKDFFSERSSYNLLNGKLEIVLHLKNNEIWRFVFI